MTEARMVKLFKDRAFETNVGTETLVLPRNVQYLALFLKVRAENTSTGNSPDAVTMPTIESAITKIEITAGQEIVKEYSGEMCRTLATYATGRLPYTLHTQANGTTYVEGDPTSGWSESMFPIYFSDPKNDPYGDKTNMMLPAPLYDSLIMNIEYNFPTTAGAGFYDGGTYKMLSLYALVIDEEDEATMMNKKVLVEAAPQDHTTAATGEQNFDLTVDPDSRLAKVTVSCYEAGISEGVDVTDVKHKINGNIVQIGKWGDIQTRNAIDCNLQYEHRIHLTAIGTTDELFTRIPSVYADLSNITDPGNDARYLTYTDDKVTVTTTAADDVSTLVMHSDVLPRTVVMDYNLDGSLRHLIPLNIRTSQLVLTQGAADGTVVVIESILKKPRGF